VRAVQSGSAMAGAHAEESKALVKVYAVLEMVRSGNALLNKTYLILENLWPDELTIDHVAVASKSGSLIAERGLSISLRPGMSIQLKPSDIASSLSIYDDDFWRFKREVGYIEIHVDIGGQGASFKSYPEYRAEAGPLMIETVASPDRTVTTTVTRTETRTVTTTPTSTITSTATSTVTSTYVTTPIITVTTTCTLTTCSISRYPATAYTIVRVTGDITRVTVTVTSVVTHYYCILSTVTQTLFLTKTTTTPNPKRVGTISCAVCGTCPTGLHGSCPCPVGTPTPLYQIPVHQATEQDGYPLHALYFMTPIAALALAPTHMNPRRWRGLTSAVIALVVLALLAVPLIPRGVGAQTITVTVTGVTTTSTVTSTTTTTVTATAPTTTVTTTTTITSTKTVTSTAPTSTSTACSTSLTTEYKCLGATVTLTFTERPLTIVTTTKYTTPDCRFRQDRRYFVTVTKVILSTRAVAYEVGTYSLRCGRWA